jgi:hypothetical protein
MEHFVNGLHQRVRNGDDCTQVADLACESLITRLQRRPVLAAARPGALAEGGTQVRIGGLSAAVLAGALIVAR